MRAQSTAGNDAVQRLLAGDPGPSIQRQGNDEAVGGSVTDASAGGGSTTHADLSVDVQDDGLVSIVTTPPPGGSSVVYAVSQRHK